MTEQATAQKHETEKNQDPWQMYEQRKAELERDELSPSEYQKACKRIADELGI